MKNTTVNRMLWATLGVGAVAALLSATHYPFLRDMDVVTTFIEAFNYWFLAWVIWIPLVPFLLPVIGKIGTHENRRWQALLWHGLVLASVLTLHALWFVGIGALTGPFNQGFQREFSGYLLFGFPLGFGAYVSLVAVVFAASWSAVSFSATREGLLKNAESDFDEPYDGEGPINHQAPGLVIVYDETTRAILAVNGAAVERYGYTPEAFRKLTVLDLSEPSREGIYIVRTQPASWRSTARHRDINGEAFDVQVTDHAVLFEGQWARMMLITDISAEFRARVAQEALLESERRAAELRLSLANAQMRALKLQMKPHFLFNILNTVAMMIRGGQHEGAEETVTLLGDMYRGLLELEGVDMVPLARELELVDTYLELERLRFQDRMALTREIDAQSLMLAVPVFILQPLVENAVKHGVAQMTGVCTIGVSARAVNGELVLEVTNYVLAEGAAKQRGFGVGLSNTRARLQELYGDRASLELIPSVGKMSAVVRIPVEIFEGAA